MTTIPTCDVRGCTADATTFVEPARYGPLKDVTPDIRHTLAWRVCGFHQAAAIAGEPTLGKSNPSELLMGEDLPPRLISYRLTDGAIGDPTLTLILGRDGIETQRVEVQISDQLHSELFATENILGTEAVKDRQSGPGE